MLLFAILLLVAATTFAANHDTYPSAADVMEAVQKRLETSGHTEKRLERVRDDECSPTISEFNINLSTRENSCCDITASCTVWHPDLPTEPLSTSLSKCRDDKLKAIMDEVLKQFHSIS